MEIAHLKEFVYLADTLSFKQTANHFYASRSVISRHLSALEEAIGAKLLDRSSHAVKLTKVGETFYRDAVIMLSDYETALEHVRMVQSADAGIVRIGYLRNIGRVILVELTRYIKARHPSVNLNLACMEYNALRSAISEGTVDIALGVNVDPEISRNYRSTPIYTDQFYAIMSPNNPLAKDRSSLQISELPPEKLLLPDSFVHAGDAEMADEFDDATSQFSARKHEHYYDIDAIYLKIQTEDYIVFSSKANSTAFGSDLAILPVIDLDSTFTVSAFYRDGFEGALYEACREAFEYCRDHYDPQ